MTVLQLVKDQLGQNTRVPDGTVIRFNRKYSDAPALTYTALCVRSKWYLSGSIRNQTFFRNDAFFNDVLADPIVTNIELATEWEPVA